MSLESNTLIPAGHGAPGRVGAIAGSGGGNVTPVRPSDRAGRLPKKHSGVKRKLVPPTPVRAKPHEILSIHFARHGQTVSRLTCQCGARLRCSGETFLESHRELAEAYLVHKARLGFRAASKHPEVPMAVTA